MTRFLQTALAAAACACALPLHAEIIRGALHSDLMDRDIDYVIEVPNGYKISKTRIYPILFALHGLDAPVDTYAVMLPLATAINTDKPAVIATFDAGGSWYRDVSGNPQQQFASFFFQEWVPWLEANYRIGRIPSMRGITGFSMGGYGAMNYVLARPGFFGSLSALSGAFGGGTPDPYASVSQAAADGVELPPIYLGCGLDDGLITQSRNMHDHLTANGYQNTLVETPNAAHDWTYWNAASQAIIDFHYQVMGSPNWRGFPVSTDMIADTGALFGSVYVYDENWVWSYELGAWLYVVDGRLDNGGWVWVAR